VDGLHPHDLGTFLDTKAIAIRGGHHCAQPLHRALGFGASSRASLCFYNSFEEWDRFEGAIQEALHFFKVEKK
jgi:cysteine desulfurase/selenocysteine lyase